MMDIINIAGSSTLFVRDADRTHRGLYTVEATNGSGCKKENILVQVQGTEFDICLCMLSIVVNTFIFIYLCCNTNLTHVMQTHLGNQWDPSLSAMSLKASALCLGTLQRTMAVLRFRITLLRNVRPPRFHGPWCLMNVKRALSMQPNSSRPMSTNSGSLLLTSLELADLWSPAPSLHRCNTVSNMTDRI